MGISLEKLLIEIVAYYNVVIGSTGFIAGILNITNLLKLQIRRCNTNHGKNTDIINDGRKVNLDSDDNTFVSDQ